MLLVKLNKNNGRKKLKHFKTLCTYFFIVFQNSVYQLFYYVIDSKHMYKKL